MRGSANALSSSTLQLAQLRRSALPSLSTIPFRYDDRCRDHLLRQRSCNQLTVNDDVSDEVASSIYTVAGRGPEGTADGAAIGNPLPDWMAPGQEGRRTAVSGVATRGPKRVRKGSENGRFLADRGTPGDPEKTAKSGNSGNPGKSRDPPRIRPSQNRALRSVPTGRVIKYPRKCTPPAGGAPGAPQASFQIRTPGILNEAFWTPFGVRGATPIASDTARQSATRSMVGPVMSDEGSDVNSSRI